MASPAPAQQFDMRRCWRGAGGAIAHDLSREPRFSATGTVSGLMKGTAAEHGLPRPAAAQPRQRRSSAKE
eukprot:3339336-Pleurochrysis_carterae.AAC.1